MGSAGTARSRASAKHHGSQTYSAARPCIPCGQDDPGRAGAAPEQPQVC